jgi:hypothetical protein
MTPPTSQEVASGAQSTSGSKEPIQIMFKEARNATPKFLADDSWYLIVVRIFRQQYPKDVALLYML